MEKVTKKKKTKMEYIKVVEGRCYNPKEEQL